MAAFEAAVIGAGPAGLAAALALAHRGIRVALIAPPDGVVRSGSAPVSAPRPDRRTTALIGPSVRLLENLGVWDRPSANGDGQSGKSGEPAADCRLPTAAGPDRQGLAPIRAVRIADGRGGLIRAPETVFRAAEIGLASFGVNVPNEALLAALRAAVADAEGLTRIEAAVTTIAPSAAPTEACVRLALADGGAIEAALAVAADGRGSRAPEAAGIPVRAWSYRQAALATSFAHSRPHCDTVNELHRPSGPLTTVPLAGRRSALVWVEAPEEAQRLAGLGDAAFAAELEERLEGVLGAVSEVEPRAVHPLSGRRAETMAANRVALVGEAAHAMPPIGAQGLNLGLRDAATLADCVDEAGARGEDIGGTAALRAYDRARAADVLGRTLTVDLLNRTLLTDLLPLQALRALAVHALAGVPPLRRLVMREGAGLAGRLPTLMREVVRS